MTDTADVRGLIGKTIAGRYELVSVLGAGGMGVVFKARQIAMNRFVAVKLLHAHYSSNRAAVGRFEREMQATAKIEHPNTIRVYDYGQTEDGQLFLAMELLGGRTLATALADDERPMPVERLLHIGVQIAKALTAAHSEGVVHRDLKPENVMLLDQYGERDFVKVLDFGIARFVESDTEQQRLTAEGAVVGTPAYMSPEQATGAPPDYRTDIYSFGVMLFEMATGAVPFSAPTTVSLMVKHVQESPPRPSEVVPGHISVELEQIIMQCLEKAPKARPGSAEELARRLEACLPHRQAGALAAETRKTPASEDPRRRAVSGDRAGGGRGAPKKKSRLWLWLTLLVVVGGGGTVAALALTGRLGGGTADPVPVATADASGSASSTGGADGTAGASDAEGPSAADGGAADAALAAADGGADAATVGDAGEEVEGDDATADVEGEVEGDDAVADDAVAAAEDAVADAAPVDPRAELAVVFLDAGEPDAPESCKTRGPAGTLEVLVKAGRLLAGGKPTELRPGDQEAYDLLKEHADLIATSPEGQVFLARALLRVNQLPGEALATAQKAVELCDWALAHHVLGNVYQAKGESMKAKQSYLRAKDREPDFAAPLFNAVLIELGDKRAKEAAALLDDLIRRKPDFPAARTLRGQANLMAGDAPAAVVDLEVATEKNPRDAAAWMLLGQARQKTGEADGAKAAFCKAKELGLAAAAARCP